MTTLQLVLALTAMVLVVICPPQGRAAEIRVMDGDLCAMSLEGEITSGDYDRLVSLMDQSRFDPLDDRTSTLCLNSPGGSYSEGLRMSELIFNRGVSTVVADGAECFSACAILFMAGVSPDRLIPLRMLSAGGVLGFHAPFLALPDRTYSKEDVEDGAQSMRMAVLALARFASLQTQMAGDKFLKMSLITRILEKGPEEMFFVRTIADAARWDIIIYDSTDQLPKPGSVENSIKNLCINFHYANMDREVPRQTNLSVKIDDYVSRFHNDDFRLLVYDNESNSVLCEIYPKEYTGGGKTSFFACSFDYWSSRNFGDCREYRTAALIGNFVPEFFTLNPRTVLKRFQ